MQRNPQFAFKCSQSGFDCVMAKAADGYNTEFALAELDPAVTDKKVLCAFST